MNPVDIKCHIPGDVASIDIAKEDAFVQNRVSDFGFGINIGVIVFGSVRTM